MNSKVCTRVFAVAEFTPRYKFSAIVKTNAYVNYRGDIKLNEKNAKIIVSSLFLPPLFSSVRLFGRRCEFSRTNKGIELASKRKVYE